MKATAGVLLGAGLGGMLDGIVLHEVLQLHMMLSAVVPPDTLAAIHLNMLWDGLFHAVMWLLTVSGIGLLVAELRRAPRAFGVGQLLGAALLGWGGFNLVEGLVDHQLLGLHHVLERAADPLPADMAFLASGVLLMAAGGLLLRAARRRAGSHAAAF